MFTELVESNHDSGRVRRAVPGTMMSVLVHVGLAYGVVAVTMQTAPAAPPRIFGTIPIEFPDPARPAPPAKTSPTPIPVLERPDIIIPPVEIPQGIPPVEGAANFQSHPPVWSAQSREFSWGGLGERSGTGLTQVYHQEVVDDPPRLVSTPPLRYPERLLRAGVEGRVVLEVVIDTAGHPEPESLRIVVGDRAPFEEEATRLVVGSLFRPGRVRGRPVRALVQVPVAFAIRK
jgi:protein TonB